MLWPSSPVVAGVGQIQQSSQMVRRLLQVSFVTIAILNCSFVHCWASGGGAAGSLRGQKGSSSASPVVHRQLDVLPQDEVQQTKGYMMVQSRLNSRSLVPGFKDQALARRSVVSRATSVPGERSRSVQDAAFAHQPRHLSVVMSHVRLLSNSTSDDDALSEIAPANVRFAFILAGVLFLLATMALVIYWVRSNVTTKASDRLDEARGAAAAMAAEMPSGRAVSFSGEDPVPIRGGASLPGVTHAAPPSDRPQSVHFGDTNPMLSKSKRKLVV